MSKKQGPSFQWGGSRGEDTAFEQQLKRGAEKIVAAAEGKICGDCASYTGTSCLTNTSTSTGLNLEITDPGALACCSWEEAKPRKGEIALHRYGRG